MSDIVSWQHRVDEALQSKRTTGIEAVAGEVGKTGPAAHVDDYSTEAEAEVSTTTQEVRQVNEYIDHTSGTEEDCISQLDELLKGVDFTTSAGPAHKTENLKKEPLDGKSQEPENNQPNTSQKERELERIRNERENEAAREKAAARAKEAIHKLTGSAKPSASGSEENMSGNRTKRQSSEETTTDDGSLIRRCLRSVIPSIAATTGTDILELINLDILNEHLGLNLDLSDSWQRLLVPEAASGNIESFLGECATDWYAWSILKREGHFKLNLWRIIRAFETDENRRNTSREYLIGILEALGEALQKDVEWEIVPDHVPRAVMRMAIAVAKEGPEPPGIDVGDEDFQIDPFLAMIANKSESSLFGTPDTDNPRYWDFWMRRGGFVMHPTVHHW